MTNDVDFLKWVVGIFITFAGAVIAGFTKVFTKISTMTAALHVKIDTQINDVKETRVRRDDFIQYTETLQKSMVGMHNEQRADMRAFQDSWHQDLKALQSEHQKTNARIDQLISKVGK